MSHQLGTDLAAGIEAIFDEFYAQGKSVPGIAYGVVRHGEVILSRGLGTADANSQQPIDSTTVFRIASMSKSFTAAGILILRDAGKLTLDDRIRDHVPALTAAAGYQSAVENLTIRHCLSMAGGLPTDDPWADRLEALPPEEFQELLRAGIRFNAEPGVQFEYSNLGFALLGSVIEAVTDQSDTDFVDQRLIEPLGLTATTYDYALVPSQRLATGHRISRTGPVAVPFTSPGAFSAIGGVLSNVEDIAVWMGWLLEPFREHVNQKSSTADVLSLSSRREMQRIHRTKKTEAEAAPQDSQESAKSASGYGFGLQVDEHPRSGTTVHHSGGYPGFGSHMRWNLETGWGVVAYGNAKYSPVTKAAASVLDLILESHSPVNAEQIGWPVLREAQQAVEDVVRGADPHHRAAIFSPNVLQDIPADERAANLADLLADTGPLLDQPAENITVKTPATVAWDQATEHGAVHLELRMTPTTPPLIHTYSVTPKAKR